MKSEQLIAILYFGGAAFGLACGAILAQLAFLEASVRLRRWLLPLVPVLAWAAMAANIAVSHRSINYQQMGDTIFGDRNAAWINRGVTALVMAIATAKIVQTLFSRHSRRGLREQEPPDQSANRTLFLALLAFVAGSLIMPMLFAQHPGFEYQGIPAVLAMCAIYVGRREPLEDFITGAKWVLIAVMVSSLVMGLLGSNVAVQQNYSAGWIPGLRIRLWGLTPHANALGALALYLILLQLLSPSRRRWINLSTWFVVLAVLILSQSKTNWLSGILAGVCVVGYRWGRLPGGGMRPTFLIAILLGLAVLATAPLFVDMVRVYEKFMETDTGANFTTLTGRTEIWAAALQMWKDSPVFGYGLDAWAPLHRMELRLPFATHAHNQLMQAMSVGGAVDALTLIAYVVCLSKAAFRAAQRTRGVSLGLWLYTMIRCVTEAPLDFSNLTSADVVAHLVLFAIVVNEAHNELAATAASPAGSQGRQDLVAFRRLTPAGSPSVIRSDA